MRLASLNEFRRLVYTPESAPAIKTLRARIRAGKLAGGRLDEDGHYYVDLDAYDRQHNLRAGILEKVRQLEADPLLAGLL